MDEKHRFVDVKISVKNLNFITAIYVLIFQLQKPQTTFNLKSTSIYLHIPYTVGINLSFTNRERQSERRGKREPRRSNISCPRMHRSARIRRASNACRKINIIHARLRMNLSRTPAHSLVFSMTSDVSSKTSGISPFRKVTKAASLHGSRGCIPDASRRNVFSRGRSCRKEIISTALTETTETSNGRFSFLFFLYFFSTARSARRLTRLDSGEADEGEGLETTRVRRVFLNFSADLREPREASETTRPFFRVKFLVPLMHLKDV